MNSGDFTLYKLGTTFLGLFEQTRGPVFCILRSVWYVVFICDELTNSDACIYLLPIGLFPPGYLQLIQDKLMLLY